MEENNNNNNNEKLGRFQKIGREIGDLVQEKNAAYGNSFGKVADFLKILWPNGIPVDSYTDALCTVRMFDKLMRIANKKDAFGESPYRDIGGYAILGVEKDEQESDESPEEVSFVATDSVEDFTGGTNPFPFIKLPLGVDPKLVFTEGFVEEVEEFERKRQEQLRQEELYANGTKGPKLTISEKYPEVFEDVETIQLAQMQEAGDQYLSQKGNLDLLNAEDSKVEKDSKVKEIETWIEENLERPQALEEVVWRTVDPALYSVQLKKDDQVRVVCTYTAVPDEEKEGTVVDVSEHSEVTGTKGWFLTIQMTDEFGNPTLRVIDSKRIKTLKKKTMLKFSSEQERDSWYRLKDTSAASASEAVSKLSDKIIAEHALEAKASMESVGHKVEDENTEEEIIIQDII